MFSPLPWPLALARLQGALPWLPKAITPLLALRSLDRLWAHHVTCYPFDVGVEFAGNREVDALVRSVHRREARGFASWIARRGSPAIAQAATTALRIMGTTENFSGLADADIALDRLEALLPAHDPLATMTQWVAGLRDHEIAFLEGTSEVRGTTGMSWISAAPPGAAWAAALAASLRPHLFGLGAAPLALAGLVPRAVFRPEPEDTSDAILAEAIAASLARVAADLAEIDVALTAGNDRLAPRYASSRAREAWGLLIGLGPLTRADLTRALEVTPRTASQAALALEEAGLITAPTRWGALVPNPPTAW